MTGRERPLAPQAELLAALRDRIAAARGVVILTGAGVSAESGVPTFRDTEGVWSRFRPEDLATPEAFRRDPARVWEWYDLRRRAISDCEPNPGHRAVAQCLLQREDVTLVTQNVDGLHGRAMMELGAPPAHPRILELHGTLFRVRCSGCQREASHVEPLDVRRLLPHCAECGGLYRPAVVWFGEMLPAQTLDTAFLRASEAEICIVAGTSAVVHPAASVPLATLRAGGSLIEVNPEPTPLSSHAEWSLRGTSAVVLPALLGEEAGAPDGGLREGG
jgi:NAD-dependent deacetylase